MKLTNKLRTGVLAAGLVAALGTSGCTTNQSGRGEDETLLGLSLMVLGIKKNDPAAAAVGRAMVDYGTAKAGRNEVNVYTNEGRNNYQSERNTSDYGKQSIVDEDFKNSAVVSKGQFYYFAANYWKDFNGNGAASPNEFVGIKKRFIEDEKLTLVSQNNRLGLKGHKGKMEVYSPNGNIIDTDEFTHPKNTGTTRIFSMNSLVERGGYGNYRAVWSLDGKYDGSTEFEIVPSLTNRGERSYPNESSYVKHTEQSRVNENFKNSTNTPQGKFHLFVANYWKDFNEDGYKNPKEFVGIKKIFREDEGLIFVLYDNRFGLKGHKGEMKVYSPNGTHIGTEDKFIYDYNRGNILMLRGSNKIYVERHGYGNYKVVWKRNGKYDGSTEFEIVPSFDK